MAIAIRDVARACGVHVSTASRAFSAPHLVSAATRARVLAVAKELGYRPNHAARALTTGRTYNIGLIVADIANPYFPPMIKAAQERARQQEYHVYIADTGEDADSEEGLVRSLAKQVDGILLGSPRISNQLIAEMHADIPLVVVNRQVSGVPAVTMSVERGIRQAVTHLADLGHERLAFLAGPVRSWTNREKRRAAATAAQTAAPRPT
jgi:LacI family transcriptional regulator